ncbi:hypothetical protein SprV_0802526200 [Sparganum proliferum]
MAIFGHNSIILFGWTRDDSGYRIERYDPDGANNEDLGPVHERLFATYIGVGDNVYVVGGRLGDEQGNETDQIDKCNILTRQWTPSSPLAYPRCETATLNGDEADRSEIGRRDPTSALVQWRNQRDFQSGGRYPVSKDVWKSMESGLANSPASSFKIFAGISPGPGDLDCFSLINSVRTIHSVN